MHSAQTDPVRATESQRPAARVRIVSAAVGLALVLGGAGLSAAPLSRLTAVYKAAKVILVNGVDVPRRAALRTALAEAEDAVETAREREALAKYQQLADLYDELYYSYRGDPTTVLYMLEKAKAEGHPAPTYDDARKLHKEADDLYLNKPIPKVKKP